VALSSGRLWHLFSDESSYVFARESEEERVLVVFNNSKARAIDVTLRDTPLQDAASATRLFGEASVKLAGTEAHIDAPAQSISIFVLN
jgi:hypothetical protein